MIKPFRVVPDTFEGRTGDGYPSAGAFAPPPVQVSPCSTLCEAPNSGAAAHVGRSITTLTV